MLLALNEIDHFGVWAIIANIHQNKITKKPLPIPSVFLTLMLTNAPERKTMHKKDIGNGLQEILT